METLMNLVCKIFGHKLGPIVPVYCNPEVSDENGIGYYCRICERCDKRFAPNEEEAQKQRRVCDFIGAQMNASRAQYGLPPLDWHDHA